MSDNVSVQSLISITSAFIYDAIVEMWKCNKSQVKLSFCVFQMKGAMGTEAFLQHELNRFSETSEIPLGNLIASALVCVLSHKSKTSVDVYPAVFLRDIWQLVIARSEKVIIERSASTLFHITQSVSLYVYKQVAVCKSAVEPPVD